MIERLYAGLVTVRKSDWTRQNTIRANFDLAKYRTETGPKGSVHVRQNLEVISDGYDRKSISGRKDELGLFYISNPVFDGGENGRRKMGATPFETPETSPSRLDTEGDDDDEEEEEIMSVSPPLTPMKKLPAAVVDGGGVSSTSSSGTPCTSSFSW
nr:hypothetical protein [Tanacetum cinerariifolium]